VLHLQKETLPEEKTRSWSLRAGKSADFASKKLIVMQEKVVGEDIPQEEGKLMRNRLDRPVP